MIEDLLLIGKIRKGDVVAFETLFRKFYSPLVLYSTGITGSSGIAEDIIQELFYSIWKNRERLEIVISVKSYLYRSVRNNSLSYLHKRDKPRNADTFEQPYTHNPESETEGNELKEIITRSISSMPQRRAEIFLMHRFRNLKYKEIAQQLSLSVKTVELEMSRALKTLEKEIELYHQIS